MVILFDKDSLKNKLSIDQVFSLVTELGGEPKMYNENTFISKTICHNDKEYLDDASYKLYYYDNTHLFHCYTGCEEPSFDIFQLVMKVFHNDSLFEAIKYVACYFGYTIEEEIEEKEKLSDWNIIEQYNKIDEDITDLDKKIELKIYNSNILNNLPHPRILNWEREGISKDVIRDAGICYDPVNQGIVIPHYDINNNLIGIRERTLIKSEEDFGKYKPAFLNGKLYNHPLGFNLYNLNNSKYNIKILKKAIIFEAEKSSLMWRSFFDNDISVAVCGSNLTSYQVSLLLSLGVEEICIAFDRQFQSIGDEEYKKWTKKLENINKKYKNLCQISYIFDRRGLLNYKDSPIDKGKEIFLKLYERRISL